MQPVGTAGRHHRVCYCHYLPLKHGTGKLSQLFPWRAVPLPLCLSVCLSHHSLFPRRSNFCCWPPVTCHRAGGGWDGMMEGEMRESRSLKSYCLDSNSPQTCTFCGWSEDFSLAVDCPGSQMLQYPTTHEKESDMFSISSSLLEGLKCLHASDLRDLLVVSILWHSWPQTRRHKLLAFTVQIYSWSVKHKQFQWWMQVALNTRQHFSFDLSFFQHCSLDCPIGMCTEDLKNGIYGQFFSTFSSERILKLQTQLHLFQFSCFRNFMSPVLFITQWHYCDNTNIYLVQVKTNQTHFVQLHWNVFVLKKASPAQSQSLRKFTAETWTLTNTQQRIL